MESKRQKQVAEVIKRNFAVVLREEGGYIYGNEALVTVTSVKMSPDMGQAKIYLSVYNIEDKQNVILLLENEYHRLKNALYHRIRKHTRRMPSFAMYLDDTLDEMWKLNSLFNKLDEENQMGRDREASEEDS